MRKLLLFVLIALATALNAQAQDCPRIFTKGDTLYTDPAPQYQWFRDDNPINGATKQWYLPTKGGNFSVQVSGTTAGFSYTPPTVEKTITGRIVDERYEPIADVLISVGVKNVKSDAKGRFILEGVPVSNERIVVTITKHGFWKNSQRLHFFDQDTAALTAMLEPLKVTNRFDAQKGATISERGFFLTFPPNSAVTESGQVYTGTVNISLKRSFPSEDGFGLRMPGGDFSAIDQNRQEKMLVSYGFMSAEMNGSNGEKLQLASDKEATLEFYIPWEQNKTAPDSMPLWHFDETAGTWRPEGIARKVGPRYVGSVKHFSSWNCDYPQNRATVKGKVLDCKGNPVSGRIVQIGEYRTATDKEGKYAQFIPAGITFQLTAGVDTMTISPINEGATKDAGLTLSNHTVDAIGWIDTTGKLTVYGDGVESYSVDGGKTFHPKSEQLAFVDNYPLQGISKDSLSCDSKFRIYHVPKISDCKLIDSDTLTRKTLYENLAEALNAKTAVYRLRLIGNNPNVSLITIVFPCLQTLILSGNASMELPLSIGQLYNLQRLELQGNKIADLPVSIGQLQNLQDFILTGNQLTSLPESIGQLQKLSGMSISLNQLTNLPESIGQLRQLEELNLSGNRLIILPESFSQLENLQKLWLNTNRLTSLPESFGQLRSLRYLLLYGNQLSSLPESISNLKDTLETLDLRTNPISEEEKAKIRSWLPKTEITF